MHVYVRDTFQVTEELKQVHWHIDSEGYNLVDPKISLPSPYDHAL